jgi:hypothetical protein
MADAIYDFIAAGVPHSVAQVHVSDSEFGSLGFSCGRVTVISELQCEQLKRQFKFQTQSDSGVAVKLAVDLACVDARVAVLDLGSQPPFKQFLQNPVVNPAEDRDWHVSESKTASATRFIFTSTSGMIATAIYYGSVDSLGLRQSAMSGRSTKILCLEDRLWDVEGGAKYASIAIDVARSAGRKTMLVCQDSECVFRNRDAMRSLSDKGIDYLVGDSEAVLHLHGLNRLDSLVPRLRALSTKAILWRGSHAPLVVEREIENCSRANGKISAVEFWTIFLPGCVLQIARDQHLSAASNILKSISPIEIPAHHSQVCPGC